MRLSAKGRYAVTCIMDVAVNEGRGAVALASVAKRQGLSLSYVEQLFSHLRKAELVVGVRGPGGGYRLAEPPASISVADVILAVEDPVDTTACRGDEDCQAGDRCLTHDLWSELSGQIQEFLGGISLRSLINADQAESDRGQSGLSPSGYVEL